MATRLLAHLREFAADNGLAVRGVFASTDDDGLPALAGGDPVRAIVLIGNEGSSLLWPVFAASPEYGDGKPDPLDRWTRRIGEVMAQRFAAVALFPFDGPPHHPFQRWAIRTGEMFPSPVGLLAHPEYGLWHAFRFAIGVAQPLAEVVIRREQTSPCIDCAQRPCLSACPVDAFVDGDYLVHRCVAHLVAHPGGSCIGAGCLARHACPVGQAHRYLAAQAEFHMQAFVGKRTANP